MFFSISKFLYWLSIGIFYIALHLSKDTILVSNSETEFKNPPNSLIICSRYTKDITKPLAVILLLLNRITLNINTLN